MDGTPDYSTYAFASEDLGNVNDHRALSAVGFNVFGLAPLYPSEGTKRKSSAVNRPINLKDGSSLVLGLGCSSGSCTTMCSGKEMEVESSTDLGLNISAGILNAVDARKPLLDLQLSLSTGPIECDVTTKTQEVIPYWIGAPQEVISYQNYPESRTTPEFVSYQVSSTQEAIPYQNYPESPALASALQLVDEGSTSSRLKTGPLFAPLQNVEIPIPLHQDQNSSLHSYPITPTFSSTSPVTTSLAGSPGTRQPRKISVKVCNYFGCTRGARGASGLCIAHGGGRRCQSAGCQKGAEGKTVFCKAHGGGKRCQHLGCIKSAEGRTDYCIGHGGGKRCSHDGCSRAARGKSGLCIRHGGGKRCQMENCTKSAEGISGLCISHGGGRRCQYPECTKGAQGSTMLCKAHGGGRRCTSFGCPRGAEGSTLFCKGHGGGKRCTSEGCTKSVHGGTLFCVGHGGGKRCAVAECTKSARGRTSYCVRHGGGKRCQFEGCTKSAQGSTDFCKAHGGGKRCSWGQLASGFGGLGDAPCDKFARGKLGLCASHSAQLQDRQINGCESSLSTQINDNSASGSILSYPDTTNETASIGSIGYQAPMFSWPMTTQENSSVGYNAHIMDHLSLPEGRVHGGSLMAMLRGSGAAFGTNNNNSPLEPEKSRHMPHSWV